MPENLRRRPWLAAQAPLLTAALAREVSRSARAWDGVISHWLVPSGLATSQACRGRPHVAVAHSGDVWLLSKAGALGEAALSRVLRGPTALATVNPILAESLVALDRSSGGRRASVIPLGPDTLPTARPDVSARLERRLESSGIAPRDVVVATLSRLVPVKGIDLLLDALSRPSARGLAIVVAGDGPEHSKLEALARHHGVKAAFLGAIAAEEKSALLERAEILAVPSRRLPSGRSEGTPVAAIEGMAAGVAVVASDVGGLRWALGDAGILFEPGSREGLAEALGRLREDATLRGELARRGRRRAAGFGWSASAAKLEALLEGMKVS